ncbi:HAD-IIA family hydrolase [Thaumasiovibrio subtropicus]|uniref:HAD-IIA family hydrolase n=1 Tax=Thaumasiovibrio subtropicus TaxID=1891207 RepID=UPI000B3622FD|nr:HAD-IIA family hydrolase [Thaumasiovibrio subtropicus]
MTKSIQDVGCFLLDMDGTIYLGDKLIEGAAEFLNALTEQGKQFIFLTNNSSKNRDNYQQKLANLGIEVEKETIFTSGEATTIYLQESNFGKKVFLLGNASLRDSFVDAGFELVDGEEKPDVVVLGFDTTMTYDRVWQACDWIIEGVPYVATHPDFVCPLAGGKVMPDTGAMIEMIEATTGKRPYVVGKPNAAMIDALCQKYQLEKGSLAMVGDRIYTDVKIGKNANITSCLVLSGETKAEDVETSHIQPDYVFGSVDDIRRRLAAPVPA